MTATDVAVAPAAAPAEAPSDPIASLRALAGENAALVQRLRGAQIPQHVGMAAACRALAVELPRSLAVQLDADIASGALAQRWDAAREAAAEVAASRDLDPSIAAIAVLLRDQGRAMMRGLLERGKDWSADAYRLEGQAEALEVLNTRIGRIALASGVPDDAPAASEPSPIAADDRAVTER